LLLLYVSDYSTEGEEDNNLLTPTQKLAQVAFKYNLSDGAIRELATIMRDLGADVPIDPRTIMRRTRKNASCNNFHHFGLIDGILRKLKRGLNSITTVLQILISIDGIPLSKSSSLCFWPILARVINIYDTEPFEVSIHCGTGSPPDMEAFLKPFIEEMLRLEAEGLYFKGKRYDVELIAAICDAQGRKKCQYTKGCTGEGGCGRCIQAGRSYQGRWIFESLTSPLRTDQSFRNKTHRNHHNFLPKCSPLEKLPRLDMIYGFPLDYMHLVCIFSYSLLVHLLAGGIDLQGRIVFSFGVVYKYINI